MKKTIILLLCLILTFSSFSVAFAAAPEMSSVDGKSAILIDVNSGNVLWSKNKNERVYPASVTKMMTAILFIEQGGSLDKVYTVGNVVNTTPAGSSIMGLKVGEEVTGKQLLYGLMLVSGNDAAIVIGDIISGSQKDFAALMNQKAKSLGMSNTNFVNPHGFHDKNHYTTAGDYALLTQAYLKSDLLVEISSTGLHVMPATNKAPERYMFNSNKLVSSKEDFKKFNYEGAIGVKTGFTNAASQCISAAAVRGDKKLAFLVFGAASGDKRYTDAARLFDYGFNEFEYVDISKYIKNTSFPFSAVELGIKEYEYGVFNGEVNIKKDQSVAINTEVSQQIANDIKGITTESKIYKNMAYPIKKGDTVGEVQYKYNEKVFFTAPLVASDDVSAKKTPNILKTLTFNFNPEQPFLMQALDYIGKMN